ncbi:FHA domain-containing protein [Phenylobacterium sp.]|uniref:multiheme c-type cytochrome n=1 Tax=Phenylobacterium sp. TaxID=1871053 RepID=UPI0012106BD1|nr:FHA domain-containing protein [Phenylobacterium sp.]THD61357.1 MAG: FHA domain-containing protein [Phenylobacterium sp.]
MTQAITLRLITRQAGGGEIVRVRRIDWGEALIGRSPEADIHLPDLAVDMEHALLQVTGQGRVTVKTLTGEPFLVDGKTTSHVELEVVRGHVITFGDFNLLLGQGGEGDVAVTILKREEEPPATSASLFSLRATMFGRRKMAWTLGLVILTLCLLAPLISPALVGHARIHPDRQWSSGPLSKAHAFLEKDCQACHAQAFVSVRDQACLACHNAGGDAAKIDARVGREGSPFLPLLISDHAPHDLLLRAMPPPPTVRGRVAGMFETAMNHPSDRCASCHREHAVLPADPAAPKTADILRAGKPALVVVNDCAACHSRLKMRLPSTGLVDTPSWDRHPDFRPLVTVGFDGPQPRLQRVALSAHPQEVNGLTFSHRIHMDPTGGAARQGQVLGAARGYGAALTCQSCHRPDGAGFKPIEMERDCGACHSLAFAEVGGQLKTLRHHDMRNVAGVLRGALPPANPPVADPAVLRRALAPGGLCVDCHTVTPSAGPLGRQIAPVHIPERMLPWGDFNHAVPAHSGVGAGAAACADCHQARTSDRSQDLLIEGVATCRACHGKTEHETTAFAGAQCSECHSYHQPGESPRTGQDRLFTALGLPKGAKPRGLPTF